MRHSPIAFALSLLCAVAADAATVDVTTCGTVVPDRTVGVLQNDLDCQVGPNAIRLGRGATLDLNGHTVTYEPQPVVAGVIVLCDSRCTVQGPGALVGIVGPPSAFAAIHTAERGRATVRDVAISGVANGIVALNGIVRIADSSIAARQWGIATVSRALVDRVTIDVAEPGGYCIGATDESGSLVKGSDVTLAGCPHGIWASRQVKLDRLTAIGLGATAIWSRGATRLRDSTVTGSGDFDIVSRRRPKLTNTACDRSAVYIDDVPNETWGVCAND